jgi:hypothetical protein
MQKNLPSNFIDDQQTGSFQPISQKKEPEQTSSFYKEGEPRRIEKKEFQPPPETKEWVTEKKTAEEITLPQPVKDEYGEILLKSARPSKPTITLPLDDKGIKKAKKKGIGESIRWLVAFCIRLIKKFPNRVIFKNSQ